MDDLLGGQTFGDDFEDPSDDGWSGDDDNGYETATLNRTSWPTLRQFCVFLENRVGKLHDLLRHIEKHDLKVVALSIVDTVDFAVARVMVNQTDRARELFKLNGFTFFENDVIGVVLPDDPQPYLKIFLCLLGAEMNIHYTYPLNYRRGTQGVIAIHVEDTEKAMQILESNGFEIVTESDLTDDPFA